VSTTLSLRNPRTGQPDGELAIDDGAAIAALAGRLRTNQPAWASTTVGARCGSLHALADAIARRREALIDALCSDTGRWHESVLEVDSVIGAIHRWAADAPALLREPAPRPAGPPHVELRQAFVPYALVGAISPWNFPLLLALIDAIPALAAGCAVLVKPSEVTPRFIAPLREALAEVPVVASVLGFVIGGAESGAALVGEVDLLCFTGSVRTGRRIGEECARRFIPAFLELGGKDAAIVLSDADIARAAKAIAWGGFVNGGQSCMSIERVYVEEPVADQFIAALVAEARLLRLAHPMPRDGHIGPIIASAQIAVVREHLAEAKARGARALTGGDVIELDGGSWCPPTVLVDVTPGMKIIAEETFASVLPVMRVRDESDAIACANETDYGLSAAVFSASLPRAERVARRLQAGAISINDAALTAIIYCGEKQSFKQSGLGGSRMGPASIRRFVRPQALLVNTGRDSPWWFA
jgi:acyl-CoA reductase-like NAD-dependent aldehyde dehydrogenase